MKNILQIIIVFIATMIASAAVVGLAIYLKPELFGRGGPSAADVARVDSIAMAQTQSILRTWHPTYIELSGIDTTKKAMAAIVDTTKKVAQVPAKDTVGTGIPNVNAVTERPKLTSADSLRARERKSMAKVIESMEAESAAKILKDLSDPEVKEIILTIKKRQAAKILGALDPERAARIMR